MSERNARGLGRFFGGEDSPEVGIGSAARRSIQEAIRSVFRPESAQGVLEW